jgi:hypothetical protein
MSNTVAQRHLSASIERNARASAMKSVLIGSQFSGGVYIQSASERDNAIMAAAEADPLYSSMGIELGKRQALSDASAVREYSAEHGKMPSDDLLAAAHGALENLFSNNQAISSTNDAGMLLSSMSESNLSSEKGTIVRATTAALTLPTMLSNPMNDIVSYLPVRKNETEIFLIDRVAGKTLGDFTKNQIIDELTSGQYSHQRQRYIFADAESPDGVKTEFTFNTVLHTPALTKLPFRQNSVKVYFNRQEVAVQLDDGELFGSIILADKTKVLFTGTVDHDTGTIVVKADKALADGTKLHAEFEIDIESNADLIPTIDHKMRSFKLKPHSRVISADASIMSIFTAQTEFGIDVNSMNLTSMRNLLVDERSKKQLADLMFFVQEEREFDAQIPADSNDTWLSHFEYIKGLILSISQSMININKESGLKGLYAGTEFSTFCKMLPASIFTMTANYEQQPRIHMVGTLLGGIKVFEVPFIGIVPPNQALGYARTEKLGKAPYFTGDVIPPTLYSQEVNVSLNKTNVIWANGYDNAAPDCADYLVLITLKNFVAS